MRVLNNESPNKVEKKKFNQVIDLIKEVNPFFLSLLSNKEEFYYELEVYEITIGVGELLFHNGKLSNDFLGNFSEGINEIAYSKFPLGMVVSNDFELFLDTGRDFEYDGIPTYPLKLLKPGDLFGVFETCDAYSGSGKSIEDIPPWSISCGCRTCFILPHQYRPFRDSLTKFQIKPGDLKKGGAFFNDHSKLIHTIFYQAVNSSQSIKGALPQCLGRVLVFPKSWVDVFFKAEDQISSYLMKVAWNSTKHIRDDHLLQVRWYSLQAKFENEDIPFNNITFDIFKYIVLAGHGERSLFVRSNNKVAIQVEEAIKNSYDVHHPAIFTIENLSDNSPYNCGYLSLNYIFNFYNEKIGFNRGVRKLVVTLKKAFDLLGPGEFGYKDKYDVDFYYTTSRDSLGCEQVNKYNCTSELLSHEQFIDDYPSLLQSTNPNKISAGKATSSTECKFTKGFIRVSKVSKDSFLRLYTLDGLDFYSSPFFTMFQSTVFVCLQHLLETTGSLIQKLLCSGADASNVFLLGKKYSSCAKVSEKLRGLNVCLLENSHVEIDKGFSYSIRVDVERLWQTVVENLHNNNYVKNIVVLDDGGRCIESIPEQVLSKYNVVCVEQTSSGKQRLLDSSSLCTVIDVASSKSKTGLESPLIANKAMDILMFENVLKENIKTIGVVGIGNIGKCLVSNLEAYGGFNIVQLDIKMFDVDLFRHKLQELFERCDLVLGCTGRDITETIDFSRVSGRKIFASLSSEDIEFRTLLSKFSNEFEAVKSNDMNICCTGIDYDYTLLSKGYPINFDGSPHSVDPVSISLTRGLLWAGIIQSMNILLNGDSEPGFIPVERRLEEKVAELWRSSRYSYGVVA